MPDKKRSPNFRIGDWLVQPRLSCISSNGSTAHIEPKVMQVLLVLCEHPGEVFSKEDLIQSVWGDIHVSPEVLTRAISELRRAFDDDARSPTVIHTIPKIGYRLVAPVVYDVAEFAPPDLPPTVPSPGGANRHRIRVRTWVTVLSLFCVCGALSVWAWKRPSESGPLRIFPFTTYAGSESLPAFSPDGSQIAFVWTGGERGEPHIYVKRIGGGESGATDERPVFRSQSRVGSGWAIDRLCPHLRN